MKYLMIYILFCLPGFLQSQETLDKEKVAMMAEMMYTMNKDVLTPDSCIYKEIDYVESDYFAEIGTASDLAECLALIKSTGRLEFAKDWKRDFLFFRADITEKYSGYLKKKIGTSFIEADLKNAKGEQITLANNNSGNVLRDMLEHKTQIGFDSVAMEGITGTASYVVEFISGYDRVELNATDIGKQFMMNDCDYTLLNIIENLLVLESNCRSNSLKVINFTADGKVIKNHSMAALMEMKKEDDAIQIEDCFGSSSQVVSKQFYQVLVSNPRLSLAEFKAMIDKDFLKESKEGNKVIVIKNAGSYEHKLILYTPIFHKEEITIEY